MTTLFSKSNKDKAIYLELKENHESLIAMFEELKKKYRNSKSVEVYEEQLEGWFKLIDDLREENKKLKEYNGELIENHKKDIAILCEENKKLRETIKDHQLYEERLEHRIIEFEELLHGE